MYICRYIYIYIYIWTNLNWTELEVDFWTNKKPHPETAERYVSLQAIYELQTEQDFYSRIDEKLCFEPAEWSVPLQDVHANRCAKEANVQMSVGSQAGRHSWFYYTSKQSASFQMTSHDSNALRHWWHLTQHATWDQTLGLVNSALSDCVALLLVLDFLKKAHFCVHLYITWVECIHWSSWGAAWNARMPFIYVCIYIYVTVSWWMCIHTLCMSHIRTHAILYEWDVEMIVHMHTGARMSMQISLVHSSKARRRYFMAICTNRYSRHMSRMHASQAKWQCAYTNKPHGSTSQIARIH